MAVSKKVVANQSTKVSILDAYAEALKEARVEFETEIAQQQAEFNKQKAEQEADWKKELTRKKEQDEYDFRIAKRDREDKLNAELATRKEVVSKREEEVKTREEAVTKGEADVAGLQAQVASISTTVAKAEAEGYAKGKAEAKKEFDAELRLKSAEHQADIRVKDHTIETQGAQIGSLHKMIEALKAELAESNKRVSEIATNAVTSAGNSKVTVNATPTK